MRFLEQHRALLPVCGYRRSFPRAMPRANCERLQQHQAVFSDIWQHRPSQNVSETLRFLNDLDGPERLQSPVREID
jgi:hypothetical protein